MFCYQSSLVHTELGLAVNQNTVSPKVPNPQALVFKICAQNRYKLNKSLASVEESLKENPRDLVLRNQYNQLLRASEAEAHENAEEQKRQQGKCLLYGQTIQLFHQFTRKYLHVNSTQTSWTETSNMMVELNPLNRKTALFRVLPRFKVKAEGDIIQANDQIILESVKSPGQFLHCSKIPLSYRMVYQSNFELNLSVRKSGFSIHQYCHAEKIKEEKQVRQLQPVKGKIHAGAYLRLYHRELEAYLAAEGLFGYNTVEEPHLRVRPMNPALPKTLRPTTSAITFWQIEKESSTIDGTALQWEEQCRLRHVTTRQYLKLGPDLHVSLTEDVEDPMTVFKIFPVVKLSDFVTYDSYARFQHVVSACWLANMAVGYVKQDGSNGAKGTSSDQQWTRATLRKVGAKEEMMYDDAFSLQEVANQLESDVNFVAGMAPFLKKFIADLNKGLVFTPRRLNRVSIALKQLGQFMILKGQPSKPRQKLLRNFMIVDLLVELLQCSIDGNENEKILTGIFAQSYWVLYMYLRGDSSKNVLYMARHLGFFMKQLDCEGEIGVNAALMIKELLINNRRMVDRIENSHIDKFCALLSNTKDYRYLDLLITLCACDGIAMSDNQSYITQKCLVEPHENSKHTIYYLNAGGKDGKHENIPIISLDGKHTWQPIRDFAAKSEEDKTTEQFFLEYQLNLFSSLCFVRSEQHQAVTHLTATFSAPENFFTLTVLSKGRNETARTIITEQLELITWRIAFLSLCDEKIRDGLRASFCKLIFDLFIDVGENQSVLDNLNMVFVYADVPIPGQQKRRDRDDSVLATAVQLPFVKELKKWISSFLHGNQNLVASQIQNNNLIAQVLNLVYQMSKFGYYGDTDEIKKLLAPLFGLLDGTTDLPFAVPDEENTTLEIKQLIENYRLRKRYEQSIESAAIVNVKFQVLRLCELFFNFRFNTRLERFISEFKQILSQERDSVEPKPDLGSLLYQKFELNAETEIMTSRAIKVMQDMFAETKYFSKGFVEILLDCCKYKYDTLVTRSISLINRFHSAHENLFLRAIVAQVVITEKSCTVLATIQKNLPKFRLLGVSGKLNKDNITKMKSILAEFTKYCCLHDDDKEPHFENQKILYAFRVLADVFDILSRKLHNKTIQSQNEDQRELFVMCFQFLKCLARGFPKVQQRLFDRMQLLMKIENVEAEMADLFVEIFNGNEILCLKIQAQQINELVGLLAKSKNPVVIRLLSSLLLVDNIPLKRNQSMILKALLAFRESIACIIDTSTEEKNAVIISDESNIESLKLKRYFCNIVQLLSLCAFGENKSTESICQCMFTVGELLDIMNIESLCGGVRKPFVQFLSSVFLQSTTELADTDMNGFGANRKVWSFIEILIQDFQTAISHIKYDKTIIRSLLRKPPTRIHVSVANQEHERKELFYYLFEAGLVFILEFYHHHYDPQEITSNTLLDMNEQEKITAKLFTSVKDFAIAVHPCLTKASHLHQLTITLQKLGEALNVQGAVPKALADGLVDPVSDSVKKHLAYYATESELNETLNVFAQNMQLCYGAFNTVSAQLGQNSAEFNKPYIDEEHESLPLGSEFQMLLKTFVNESHLSTEMEAIETDEKYSKVSTILHQLRISLTRTKLSERQKLQQEELDVKCLKVLRALVHNEIAKLPEFNPETKREYRRHLVGIKAVQAALADLGIIDTVIPHLSRNGDDIPRETLALLTTLLFKGCREVQEKFMDHFLSTTEESFFFALKRRMEMSASNMKEQRHLLQKHESRTLQEQREKEGLNIRHASADTLKSKRSRPGTSFVHNVKSAMGFRSAKSHKSLVSPEQQNARAAFEPSNDEMPLIEYRPSAKSAKKRKVAISFASEENNDNSSEMKPKVQHAPVVMAKNLSEDLSKLKAPSSVHLVLKLMALICDGQNTAIQDYLREQKDNIKSVNLVAECTKYLSLIYSNITHQNIHLASLIFDSLSEVVQGNPANQMVAFDNKITDYVNHIIKADSFPGCALGEIYDLKYQIGFLMKVLTEENSPLGVFNHAKVIMRAISKEHLFRIMAEAYDDSFVESLDRATSTLVQQVAITFYHLLQRVADLDAEYESTPRQSFEEQEAWKAMAGKTHSVELLKNRTLQKAFFFVENESVISEDIKERLKWNVDRSSPSNKLIDFLHWSSEIKTGLKYQRKVYSYKLGRFFINNWLPLNMISLFITFAINVCIAVSWVAPEKTDPSYEFSVANGRWRPTYPDWAKWTVLILGLCHNVSAFAILVSYFLANRPALPKLPTWCRKKSSTKTAAEQRTFLRVEFFSLSTFYYMFYMAMSILGTVSISSFFAFHMLHLAAINQLLVRVIKAVTLNGKSLLLVACLGLVLFYIYSLLGFSFLRNIYVENNLYCYTIWECFISTLREGLLTSFGDRFEPNENVRDFGLYAAKAIFDVSFFILITTIGLNIIFGIIVDTFSELRDSKWHIENDMTGTCFICGLTKYEFEHHNGQGTCKGFNHHVKKEHSMWSYLLFFIYLDDTPRNELSSLELHVHQMVEQDQTDFFPLGHALSLQKTEGDTTDERLEILMEQVNKIVARLEEEENIKQRETERQRQENWQKEHARKIHETVTRVKRKKDLKVRMKGLIRGETAARKFSSVEGLGSSSAVDTDKLEKLLDDEAK